MWMLPATVPPRNPSLVAVASSWMLPSPASADQLRARHNALSIRFVAVMRALSSILGAQITGDRRNDQNPRNHEDRQARFGPRLLFDEIARLRFVHSLDRTRQPIPRGRIGLPRERDEQFRRFGQTLMDVLEREPRVFGQYDCRQRLFGVFVK